MTANTEVLIGDLDAQHLLIRPLFRSQPDLFDVRDGNWIDCELQIAAGSFHGSFRADLRSEDFQSFSDDIEALRRTLEGTARFSTLDGQLALSLTSDGGGHVRVSGEATDAVENGNRLHFSFETDPEHIPAICQSLTDLLAAFPVIGVPDAEQAER